MGALVAVQQDGLSLRHVSDRLKADKELVLAAVEQNGYAHLYASEELQEDEEITFFARQRREDQALATSRADGADAAKKKTEVVVEAEPTVSLTEGEVKKQTKGKK